jgi:thiol-disulfide isomerase/thioredoxin
MTERLIVLAVAVGVLLLTGLVAQRWAERRRARVIREVRVDPVGAGVPRIISFYGPLCDACDRQKLVLAELESERPGRLAIDLRDAVEHYDEAQQLGLVVVPTTVVIAPDGAIRSIHSGYTSRTELESHLDAGPTSAVAWYGTKGAKPCHTPIDPTSRNPSGMFFPRMPRTSTRTPSTMPGRNTVTMNPAPMQWPGAR